MTPQGTIAQNVIAAELTNVISDNNDFEGQFETQADFTNVSENDIQSMQLDMEYHIRSVVQAETNQQAYNHDVVVIINKEEGTVDVACNDFSIDRQ